MVFEHPCTYRYISIIRYIFKVRHGAFMCYVFHRSSRSLLHCPCSPTGPGGPGRPGLPGGPSIPFGPGIPGVPVKYRHFNQIMNKTDFSADATI